MAKHANAFTSVNVNQSSVNLYVSIDPTIVCILVWHKTFLLQNLSTHFTNSNQHEMNNVIMEQVIVNTSYAFFHRSSFTVGFIPFNTVPTYTTAVYIYSTLAGQGQEAGRKFDNMSMDWKAMSGVYSS